MNLRSPLRSGSRLLHALFLACRSLKPREQCSTFSDPALPERSGIGPIFVINLDRQANRWDDTIRELDRIVDTDGTPLSQRAVRYSAHDSRTDQWEAFDGADVDSSYTLGDQLFVEPQPDAVPDEFDLRRPIKMSPAEIAVAYSHIGVWRRIAQSSAAYSLVLEDDIWIERGFCEMLECGWREMEELDDAAPRFDILYVSYAEVRQGAPKQFMSKHVFRPERGLWYLSGYVLSRKGAQGLLDRLPCRGPVDLWLNHKFRELEVRALSRSVINQRRDLHSTNSYSILPVLSGMGVLDHGDGALFRRRPIHSPVFVFGSPGSGISSLAMALEMLGYRCCSDLDSVPDSELEALLAGRNGCVFDAYVNIESLGPKIPLLAKRHPNAKYIVIGDLAGASHGIGDMFGALASVDVIHLGAEQAKSWRVLCGHLRVAPPDSQYPSVRDIGLRRRLPMRTDEEMLPHAKHLRHDQSPWVIKRRPCWTGISAEASESHETLASDRVCFHDGLEQIDPSRWRLRNDTFPGNLALFRPANVSLTATGGVSLEVRAESLGVRDFSAGALSSCASFLFGRFEATLQATNVPGLVTGFFLHRSTPRQEIDVEIRGNQPDYLLVNVFYNPGGDGANFDYGYRGTPAIIRLGFDASKALHRYAIEWDQCQIRWFVDGKLIHRRVIWDPTPIPHLPMTVHVNVWPTRSRELAGRLAFGALPASAVVRSIFVDADTQTGLTAH